ncbi:hypothetical protein PFISCL1PPCAC_15702, partial [Pristionchus fissidentatus]
LLHFPRPFSTPSIQGLSSLRPQLYLPVLFLHNYSILSIAVLLFYHIISIGFSLLFISILVSMKSRHSVLQSKQLRPGEWKWEPHTKTEEGPIRMISPHHLLLNPIMSFGTVACRVDKGLNENTTAYWEIHLSGIPYGTSVQFGIGRRHILMNSYQFTDLLGLDGNSYGVNHKGIAQRSGVRIQVTKPMEEPDPHVGLFFDGPNRSLSFFLNGEYLCTPFVNLDLSHTLYPFVSSTAQCTSLRLINQYSREEVLSLFSLSRRKVSNCFDNHSLSTFLPRDCLTS